MRLIVTAAASPIFGNFLMLVSVSAEADGSPVTKLTPKSFGVHHLASLNHAFPVERDVKTAKEGPAGFYTLALEPKEYQPELPPGHYVFAVTVKTYGPMRPKGGPATPKDQGQTIAVGDLPSYGQWK